MARRAEHDPIARRRTGRSMTRRVVTEIGFGLDDWTAAGPLRRVPDQPMTQQQRRDDAGGRLVKRSRPRLEFLGSQTLHLKQWDDNSPGGTAQILSKNCMEICRIGKARHIV